MTPEVFTFRRAAMTVWNDGRRFFINWKGGDWRGVQREVKKLEGRKYLGYGEHGSLKTYARELCGTDTIWVAPITERNKFALDYMRGSDVYAPWKSELLAMELPGDLYEHQKDMVRHILTRRWGIVAADMGTGKSRVDLTARDLFQPESAWLVAPVPGIKAMELEFEKWGPSVTPELLTYDCLRIRMTKDPDYPVPQWITFDECSRLKNPRSRRSQAAKLVADRMREKWGRDCVINLMSGSPAPNTPTDWYWLCEIACPGYLSESSFKQFEERLAIYETVDFGLGPIQRVKTWKDRDDTEHLCTTCYAPKGECHGPKHIWTPMKNEVAALSNRLDGLRIVKLKKDCLDLPEKRFEVIELPCSHEALQVARTLAATADGAPAARAALRTLSDGFLYEEQTIGTTVCWSCNGDKEIEDWVAKVENPPPLVPDLVQAREIAVTKDELDQFEADPERYAIACSECADKWREKWFVKARVSCYVCDGTGEISKTAREAVYVGTPKEDRFRHDLGRHEEIGRLVVYAAFHGSVDRLVAIGREEGWSVIKADGRGWEFMEADGTVRDEDALKTFQEGDGKILFVGHPAASGMGLTLTRSPTCIFYSNTERAEDRIQASDRIHRIGTDLNRGATIIDLCWLPTDKLVLDRLTEKIARHDLSMGIDLDMGAIMESLK